MNEIPVAMFVYRRPEHTRRCLESLRANPESADSVLHVFADGPRPHASADEMEAIRRTRALVRERDWCGRVEIVEAPSNKGLAASVIDGVSEVASKHGKVIVIEDDVEVSPYFLRYMQDALARFEGEERVASIGAWNYFCPPARLHDNFFFRFPDSIAWGVYERSWRNLGLDANRLARELRDRGLVETLNVDGAVDHYEMLLQQAKGGVDSWAIRWTASVILAGQLTLYPRVSLVRHTGYGASSTHVRTDYDSYNYRLRVADRPQGVRDIPIDESPVVLDAYRRFHRRQRSRLYSGWLRARQRLGV